MPSEPGKSEQIYDPEFEQLVESICSRPGMFVTPPTFGAVCAYLDGFDTARSNGPLIGLKEWLIVRLNCGRNSHWSGLVVDCFDKSPADSGLSDDEHSIRAVGRLLAEYFEYRRTNGLTKVFHEYGRWLMRKKWYDGPLRQSSTKSRKRK